MSIVHCSLPLKQFLGSMYILEMLGKWLTLSGEMIVIQIHSFTVYIYVCFFVIVRVIKVSNTGLKTHHKRLFFIPFSFI